LQKCYGDNTGVRTFGLDNNGNIKTITGAGFSQSYHYNSLNLLTDETLTITGRSAGDLTLVYGYDDLAHLSSLLYPNETTPVTFLPNPFGQATQAMRGSEVFAQNASYHPSGMVDTFTYGNGITHKTKLETNGMLRPECLLDYKGTTPPSCGIASANNSEIVNFSYGYDNNSNITSITNTRDGGMNSLTHLTYDGLDRLKTTTGGSGIGSSSLTYDGLGNIKTYSNDNLTNGHALTYSYTNNRLTGLTGNGSKNQ